LLVMAAMANARPSLPEVLATAVIVSGVGLANPSSRSVGAGADEVQVHWWLPLLTVLVSNLCFSLRALFAKRVRMLPGPTPPNSFIFLVSALVGACITVPWALLAEGDLFYGQASSTAARAVESASTGRWWPGDGAGGTMHWTLLANGIAYYVYNQTSFVVLSRVEMLTHTQINAVRRVYIVLVATWMFQTQMSAANMAGVVLAFVGLFAYLLLRRKR
jgi:hypothetical protein